MRFRKQALRQLEAPEQLDQAVRLATVPGWLAAVALAAVVLSVGAWSIGATVPRTVDALGVLTHSAGVSSLDSTVAGRVTRVWAAPDQRLAKGTPLYSVQDAAGVLRTEVSPWDAYVVSWLVTDGQVLQPGTRVADLERLDTPGDQLLAKVYVSATSAPLLKPGQDVEMQPASVPASVFGTLHGKVATIGAFPETEQSLRTFLGADRDVRPFLAGGSVISVTVKLDVDDSSPSGLRWSKQGPPFRLNSQSQLTARFTVAEEHPVEWLVPR